MGNEEKEKIVREFRKGYQPEQNEKKSPLKEGYSPGHKNSAIQNSKPKEPPKGGSGGN
ncbi:MULTISPECIES: hypothetical protein [Leptospira]|uniref:Uncharacterized protein n=1 Tax=Leptospira interrogans str. 2006001854 TaxID=1001590 RepID=M6GFB3_LEPIR|nr:MULTISPECIES: hypothetical protein [Leptospira]EMM81219.1 hypothetical protein LEP1GSC037_0355 [Leptospira interrogans str. 2006001854]MBE8364511.1 hypothetical protein [Leptospira borgpetersenii serovar Balcanica]MBE8368211.1 hypothetical protein [Leptospira borgpetersenii serovar Balcanica]MBE8423547.1 hypothetical protein [Leptospira borgpetersenii serovar Balcanica]MBF3350644.1 hypothetical protein [Leptospira borgpetersenii serovar Balcanica]